MSLSIKKPSFIQKFFGGVKLKSHPNSYTLKIIIDKEEQAKLILNNLTNEDKLVIDYIFENINQQIMKRKRMVNPTIPKFKFSWLDDDIITENIENYMNLLGYTIESDYIPQDDCYLISVFIF